LRLHCYRMGRPSSHEAEDLVSKKLTLRAWRKPRQLRGPGLSSSLALPELLPNVCLKRLGPTVKDQHRMHHRFSARPPTQEMPSGDPPHGACVGWAPLSGLATGWGIARRRHQDPPRAAMKLARGAYKLGLRRAESNSLPPAQAGGSIAVRRPGFGRPKRSYLLAGRVICCSQQRAATRRERLSQSVYPQGQTTRSVGT